jgi:hypothetical protein
MQGSRTGMSLAILATLGFGTLAGGCSNQSGNGQASSADQAASQVIDSFETGSAAAWTPFSTGGSTIHLAAAATHADGASSATEISYDVASAGSAGLERNFDSPQDWSTAPGLTLWVNGRGTGQSFLVQIYDAGHERWESRFKVDFSGWRQIGIPFSGLTAAAWQPPGARVDGVRDMSGVTGMALVPSEAAGAGTVDLDMLALGAVTAAPTGAGAPAPTPAAPTASAPTASAPTASAPTASAPTASAPTASAPAAPTAPAATPTAAPAVTPTAAPAATPPAAPTTAPAATPTAAPAATPTTAPAATPTAAPAASGPVTGTIIPLYTSPSDASWSAVAAAKAAHPAVPVLAVVNPSNGPGGAASPDYVAGIAKLTAAGVKVIGYVHTSWGARPAAELQTEMGQWKSWYPGVSGIFFDEMAATAGKESYYAGLTSSAKGSGFDLTIGNPGQDSAATYVGTTDVILIYENSGVPSASALGGWHTSYARTNFGVIPYNVASLDTSFIQSAKPYVGYIYLQSDSLPNPWDSVPSYLGALVGALG